mmetsp:Transcript_58522/g.171202  ORF Transcript_58522/g.171202 Transcript_58522/m.171202 type:complete len:264 (+) Transcript_58522:72-863(+)
MEDGPPSRQSSPPADKFDSGEISSRKRKRDTIEASADDTTAKPELRFQVGQQVLCNMSKKSSGFLWKRGTILRQWEDAGGTVVPYVVTLDTGSMAGSPEDDDDCIRLAARATIDVRVMRAFALSLDKRGEVHLRFIEGDRVAVQLDAGIWEEGTILEVWSVPERDGKVLRSWAGLAVPYAVRLDLGDDVFVPFDSDDVIRAESAARPPQKSIAEQLGGTVRAPAKSAGKRFVKRQNSAGHWVILDMTTGFERSCDPPDSDSEA